jgi:uncharacterized protein (DUF433 family)
MIPDNETLRMMRDVRDKMPDSATQAMIQEAMRVARDPVREAIIRQHLEFRNQYGDQIKAIAQSFAQNETLRTAVANLTAAVIPTVVASQQANSALYLEAIKSIQSTFLTIPQETLRSVAQAMQQFQTGPTLAALQTIREMGFGGLADQFADFEETISREAPTAKPKELKRAVKMYVAKQKKRGLTPEQWNALNVFLQIFAIYVAIYFGMQSAKIENHTTININNTFVEHPIFEQVKIKWYRVERPCELKARADFKSATLSVIPRDIEIRVVYSNGRWLYVEYKQEGQDLPTYGFVSKKYLKKIGESFPGIESRVGVVGGNASIARTRIPVWLLEQARRLGTSDADLLKAYPTLRVEDLTNAWGYVRTHREEIERQIAENESDEPQ